MRVYPSQNIFMFTYYMFDLYYFPVYSVLELIEGLLSWGSDHPVYEQSLKCFCSWVQFGIPLPEIEHLVCKVFGLLSNEVLFETAVETLVQVFSLIDNHK